ncbi:hypothetical protein MHBO_002885 [Bonamia ostreae]|uniref:DWNN domain-containing protein n=1 Tax=Bonamia ostreae TaxID=126728 RepID=A0ABV2ANW1_9EUKA
MTLQENVVYYKFNSTNTWRHLKQAAIITLKDLENHIASYTKIGDCNHTNKELSCSCQFKLSFFDSAKKSEIKDRNMAIRANSHILVKRYPINKKNIQRIEKQMTLKNEMDAIEAEQLEHHLKVKAENKVLEEKKKENVKARLKQLEDERWEKARLAHEKEVAELKKQFSQKSSGKGENVALDRSVGTKKPIKKRTVFLKDNEPRYKKSTKVVKSLRRFSRNEKNQSKNSVNKKTSKRELNKNLNKNVDKNVNKKTSKSEKNLNKKVGNLKRKKSDSHAIERKRKNIKEFTTRTARKLKLLRKRVDKKQELESKTIHKKSRYSRYRERICN